MSQRRLCTTLLAGLAGLLLTHAADSTIALPKSQVVSVDRPNLTFTVSRQGTNAVIFIVPDTRFFQGAKPATSTNLLIGQTVSGTLRERAGRVEALRINLPAPARP
ncbi:MAG TPA: hypothetical protein VHH73_09455 [Verrucomicrobiae bacterium]|nr:hypothetical protein [Verrucomicrobiae bacterium]